MAKPPLPTRTLVLWLLFVGLMFLVVAMGLFDFPMALPELPLGSYAPYVIFIFVILATKLVLELLKPLFKSALSQRLTHEADIAALYQVVSYTVGFIVVGTVLYLSLGGINPVGEIGSGIVLGMLLFIFQVPLLNFVGWTAIAIRRLYKLGDRIEVNSVKGYVTNIGIFGTTLREFGGWMTGDTFTGRYINVPNKAVLEYNVFNYTKDTEFVWDEVIVGVTYESDLPLAEKYLLDAANEVVGDMMRSNREIIRAKYEFADLANYMVEEPAVRWNLRDSWVDMIIIYFAPCHRRSYYKTEIIKHILASFSADQRVAVAYPHLEFVPYKQADMETLSKTILQNRNKEG